MLSYKPLLTSAIIASPLIALVLWKTDILPSSVPRIARGSEQRVLRDGASLIPQQTRPRLSSKRGTMSSTSSFANIALVGLTVGFVICAFLPSFLFVSDLNLPWIARIKEPRTKRQDSDNDSGEDDDHGVTRESWHTWGRTSSARLASFFTPRPSTKFVGQGRTLREVRTQGEDRRERGLCFYCGHAGHWIPDCPVKTVDRKALGLCFHCGDPGHWVADCPGKNERPPPGRDVTRW